MLDTTQELSLDDYAEQSYLQYAMATVKDRALAQVEDGKKPVQRRILYAMRQLGLTDDAKPVKCARIVGDVLGKYHPHGDTAAYDALVRIAQDFSLRYPLITKQGNFGSRDGDTAAAMRYTEAKLSPIARLLLDELPLGTVDFIDNYDGTLKEPARLPARLPFLLLNGTMGIAVGMASNVPSHNLREVASACALVVADPATTLDAVLEHIQGPDFPDGGQVISTRAEVREAYDSGRSSIRVRARWHREELARGQWQLVFDDAPYQVSPKQVLEELDALTNPRLAAGKKTLTQQQESLKRLGLDLIERANDESGKEHDIRIVVAPRSSKVSQDELLAYLFSNTSLEAGYSFNMTMVGLDGRPQTKGLLSVLREWAEFRVSTVRRRTRFELEQAAKRAHVLEGRLTVFLNLDQVIRVIRDADDPKAQLRTSFGLSEVQAEDILEMRLRQLNKLEGIKLERELDELKKSIERLTALLASDPLMRALVVSEIHSDSKKYGDDRRTLIKEEARAQSSAAVVRSTVDEPLTVVVSKNLWVRARSGHDIDPASLAYRAGDEAWAVVRTRSSQAVAFLDHFGRAYSVRAGDLPSARGDGVPLTTFIDMQKGARLLYALSAPADTVFAFAGARGYGLTAPFGSLIASKKAGKAFLSLQEGELPLRPAELAGGAGVHVACVASDGRLLVFSALEVKLLAAGGMGVKLMDLGEASLTHLHLVEGPSLTCRFDNKGKPATLTLKGADFDKYLLKRARKGYQLPGKGIFAGFDEGA